MGDTRNYVLLIYRCFCNWSNQLRWSRVLWQKYGSIIKYISHVLLFVDAAVVHLFIGVSVFRSLSEPLMTYSLHRDLMCAASKASSLTDTKRAKAPLHMGLFILLLKPLWKTQRGQTTFSGIRRSGRERLLSANIQTVTPPFTCVFHSCSVSLIFIFSVCIQRKLLLRAKFRGVLPRWSVL